MTLHASKGLEFPVVFIIALEEGLMPHERSRTDDDAVEEERRLLFVGITRAKEELQLSLGQYREFRGQRRMTIPSPFLLELPRDEMNVVEPGSYSRTWDEPSPEEEVWEDTLGDVSVEDSVSEDSVSEDSVSEDGVSEHSRFGRRRRGSGRHGADHVCGRELLGRLDFRRADRRRTGSDAPATGRGVSARVVRTRDARAASGVRTGQNRSAQRPGMKRRATIDFATGAGQKKMFLSSSPLRPAKSS